MITTWQPLSCHSIEWRDIFLTTFFFSVYYVFQSVYCGMDFKWLVTLPITSKISAEIGHTRGYLWILTGLLLLLPSLLQLLAAAAKYHHARKNQTKTKNRLFVNCFQTP
ncbi:hypothetical protein BKA57DRAFT_467859 [Linnemannia elongata]|nr:hypothetical protein BKA57DRAFT_467859 [Linnemannia elongata]